MNKEEDEFSRGAACPYTQTIPYVSKVAFGDIKTITPVVNEGMINIVKELKKAFREFGVKTSEIKAAMEKAEKAQGEFDRAIREKGDEVLSSLKHGEKTVVIIGRAYNCFDRGMNLEIPEKLA